MSAKLSRDALVEIVNSALQKVIPNRKIARVQMDRADSGSDDKVHVTVVLSAGNSANLSGEKLAKIREAVIGEMWKHDDDRFPHLRFLTAKEIKQLAS